MTITNAAEPKPNPAARGETPGRRKRIPMSVPHQRLQVPEIPGYHLHWFLEKNVPRALQAAYEFVEDSEVPVHQRGVATSGEISGSADLGSRIRILSGVSELAHPEYLVLMKLREEYWQEDRAEIDKQNAIRMGGIFRGEQILNERGEAESATSDPKRYSTVSASGVFNRPTRKVRTAT